MSQQPITVTVGQGRYAVTIGTQGELTATRHGERWRELAGDKLVYFLASELHEARELLAETAKCFVDPEYPEKPGSWGAAVVQKLFEYSQKQEANK